MLIGLFQYDDEEAWIECMAGMRGVAGSRHPLNFQLGRGSERPANELFPGSGFPGEMADRFPDEGNRRHFYSRWRDLMMAGDWASLPAF